MSPAEKYNSECDVEDLQHSISLHKSLDQDATSLLCFGYGDGGGGPTWEHLEKLRRCRGISDQVGLLPRATMGPSVDDFFAQLQRKAEAGIVNFATWYGELYFELHRGTYTTQANTKKNNRQLEIMLHDIELLATIASIRDSGYKYPKAEIDDMWESVLLCQFHDCLPGSSIELVYDESSTLYKKVFEQGEKLLKNVWKSFGFEAFASNGLKSKLFGFNTLPWIRKEVIELPRAETSSDSIFGLVSVDEFGFGEVLSLDEAGGRGEPKVQLLKTGR